MAYDIGSAIRLKAIFKVNNVDTDPTTTTMKLRTPKGVKTTHVYGVDSNVIKDSSGNFHYDLVITESGYWTYRWEGVGTCVSADETQFQVEKSVFP